MAYVKRKKRALEHLKKVLTKQVDKNKEEFDSSKHAVGDDGHPLLTKAGNFKKLK